MLYAVLLEGSKTERIVILKTSKSNQRKTSSITCSAEMRPVIFGLHQTTLSLWNSVSVSCTAGKKYNLIVMKLISCYCTHF